ncbi:LysR family transcriptional regulator [Gordonia hydrophobica]|uniref:LysR family transcriptional regulator n=1 Tax=Gordonia hydrophobica TaxID=40516 RepID=A0ABZ2U4J5_9ACTN|nr:LysR family transcriptional regulator [Gordonia hydrophobica]MBM7367850.1 DNA-binding transcriptional LysR family regulator [Gordonia hydrophobica]
MELRHLRYYVAVAEECHFGRAAQRLHIAQPPLSQQIKQLEEDLGVTLLNRSTRRVELTAAGQRYLERAKEILASVDAAADEAVRIAGGEIGRVSIGFTGSATYHLLPAMARRLRAELPDIDLDLHGEMLTPQQAAALHDGVIDLGFLRPPVHDRRLRYEVVGAEPMVAVVPHSHPLATRTSLEVADLEHEVFVAYSGFNRSVVFEVVIDACQRAGFRPVIRHEVGETATLVSFVAAGLGVALVPQSVQQLQITGAVYVPLAGEVPTVELAMAMRDEPPSPDLERVLACLYRVLPEVDLTGNP